jgi:hypothetical protein
LIDRNPNIRGGRPKIAGTGLTVRRIAGWYKICMTPEEIALEYARLTLARSTPRQRIITSIGEADLAQEEAASLQLKFASSWA